MDSVDKMVRDWGARRPELDVSHLEVVGRLLLCARHVERDLVAALAPVGLSFGDFDVLNTLRRMGTPTGTKPTELARSALVTSGAMSARLDRLARAGLIERAPDPDDRRGVLVTLTDDGTRLADEAVVAALAADDAFLAPLTAADRTTAAALLKRLLAPREPMP